MNNVESACSKQGFEILHSVANRVRLRALDTKTKEQLTAIQQHLRSIAGIESVRINQETGSLVITYARDQITITQLQQFLEPYGIHQESVAPEINESDYYNQTLKRLSSFIPPVVGIATVRGLGIGGWQALAAYIVTTRVTRGVMKQLDLPLLPSPKAQKVKQESKAPLSLEKSEISANDYQIIHQIPGRIRFSIQRIKQDLDYGKKLENLTQLDNRITSVRVNPEAGSVVVNYRTETGKSPLNSQELIALMELLAKEAPFESEKPGVRDLSRTKKETSLKNKLDFQKVTPVEEPKEEGDNSQIEQKESYKEQETPSDLENLVEQPPTETESIKLQDSETNSEEEDKNDNYPQSPFAPENHFDDGEQPQQEESSKEQPLNSIELAQDYQRIELEKANPASPWWRFKACMLTTMLRYMANLPLQEA